MQYNFSGSFYQVEVFAASVENWISKLYVQEFLKQSQEIINNISFKLKEKLNYINEITFKEQLDKLLQYSHHFTNIDYKNIIHLKSSDFGKGYVYIFVEDNIKKYIKHEKNYSGLFYGSYLDDAKSGWIGNIYINLTIKQDIENYISNCDKIDLLFMIKCRINYLVRVVKHEVLHAMQSLIGLHKNNGSIGYLPFNGNKDLLEYFNPKRIETNNDKPSLVKRIMMWLKLIKPQKHTSKYSILEEPQKPYEFYPYVMDAVDSFEFYKSCIPTSMYYDFIKLWLNDINEKDFIKKLPQDSKDKYILYKNLIYLFWRFLNNLPQDYKKKAIKQFIKRTNLEI